MTPFEPVLILRSSGRWRGVTLVEALRAGRIRAAFLIGFLGAVTGSTESLMSGCFRVEGQPEIFGSAVK